MRSRGEPKATVVAAPGTPGSLPPEDSWTAGQRAFWARLSPAQRAAFRAQPARRQREWLALVAGGADDLLVWVIAAEYGSSPPS